MHIEFTIPGKPQPKQRARKGRGGRFYTPAETARYERAVGKAAAWAIYSAFAVNEWPKFARYRLMVHCYFPDGRTRDWDNVFKSVADGMNGVAYRDDSLVCESGGSKQIDRVNPRTVVRLEVLS